MSWSRTKRRYQENNGGRGVGHGAQLTGHLWPPPWVRKYPALLAHAEADPAVKILVRDALDYIARRRLAAAYAKAPGDGDAGPE